MATKKSSGKLDEIVNKAVEKQLASFKKELSSQLKEVLSQTLSSAFGDLGIAGPLGAGLGNALDSVIAGRKIDARSVANAAATAFAPQVESFFNQSTSQLGEGLAGLFNAAQRNF